MKQPKDFATKGQEEKVCRLRKAIYGLKQSSFIWNKKFHEVLAKWALCVPKLTKEYTSEK